MLPIFPFIGSTSTLEPEDDEYRLVNTLGTFLKIKRWVDENLQRAAAAIFTLKTSDRNAGSIEEEKHKYFFLYYFTLKYADL